MSKQAEKTNFSFTERQIADTPPDFSQFKGNRLDKQPNLLVDGLVHVFLTVVGAAFLMAIVYIVFTYINW